MLSKLRHANFLFFLSISVLFRFFLLLSHALFFLPFLSFSFSESHSFHLTLIQRSSFTGMTKILCEITDTSDSNKTITNNKMKKKTFFLMICYAFFSFYIFISLLPCSDITGPGSSMCLYVCYRDFSSTVPFSILINSQK